MASERTPAPAKTRKPVPHGARAFQTIGMDPLEPLVASLNREGRLRVWSLVVTVLGDAVQPRGGRIATARLQRLLGRLGITPGALRTALSRLAADGWVIRDREGRNSFYRLSARGSSEVIPAAARIYAPPRSGPAERWVMAIGGAAPPGAVVLEGGAWLCPADLAPDTSLAVAVEGVLNAPAEGLTAKVVTPPHQSALERLVADLAALPLPPPDPLSAMAARILLVHRWRRIVLRFPDLPEELLPKGLAPPGPRARVAAAYAALLPASEAWLDAPGPSFPAMPAPVADTSRRFGPASPLS